MKYFLLIDDHAITRIGLRILITELFPGSLVMEASNGQEAEALFKENVFDLCTLDLNMPNTDSFDFLRKISLKYKGVKILVVSMNNEDIYAVNALKSGAMGFVSKASGFDTIKEAILKIVNNQKYISEKVVSILLGEESFDANNNPFVRLSERELEVAKLLILGDSTKEIGNKMNLEVSTISSHKNKIFAKLQVSNTIELYELYRLVNK